MRSSCFFFFFFLHAKFCQSVKLKIKKWSDFEGFQPPKSGKKKTSKNHQIFIFSFQYVTKNIERWLKICISYLFYSQIWLNNLANLPRMIATFSTSSYRWWPLCLHQKILKKNIGENYISMFPAIWCLRIGMTTSYSQVRLILQSNQLTGGTWIHHFSWFCLNLPMKTMQGKHLWSC